MSCSKSCGTLSRCYPSLATFEENYIPRFSNQSLQVLGLKTFCTHLTFCCLTCRMFTLLWQAQQSSSGFSRALCSALSSATSSFLILPSGLGSETASIAWDKCFNSVKETKPRGIGFAFKVPILVPAQGRRQPNKQETLNGSREDGLTQKGRGSIDR